MVNKYPIRTLLASALLVLPLTAYPAGMGKLTVTSSLGQPLRAEIELLTESKEDLSSLTVRMAPTEVFRDAKIEYSPVLSGINFSVEEGRNGNVYLKVSSSRPINDPFLDLLVELNWSSGRLVREYTVLLDPPGFAEQQPVAPITLPAAKPATAAIAPVSPSMEAAPAPAKTKIPAAKAAKPEAKPKAAPARAEGDENTYGPVVKGDTLNKIAAKVFDGAQKPEGLSVEQMLVGLYQENKQAFLGDNMNRLRIGQILRVPDNAKVAAIDSKEAAREVKIHATNWNEYRQKLAAAVAEAPASKGAVAQQAVTGKIKPKVEEPVAKETPSKDVLKLSKGESQAAGKGGSAKAAGEAKALQERVNSLEEEATAREKGVKEANERIAALEKNIKEMQRLLELKNQSLADLQKQAATKVQAPPAPVAAPAPTPEPVMAAKPEVATPAVTSEKPKAKPKAKAKPPVIAPPQPETHWYDGVLSNPLIIGGGSAILLLGGLLWLMVVGKRRRKGLNSFEDSIMTGGDLKANTVFGEATGGVIDTGDTSFLTDFSQAGLGTLDTNDVDPIAEAEVYMAYGRDAQAEEILKEAMHKDPSRHEIQAKLLEIYAGRKNLLAFETLASELYAAIGGQASLIWDKVAEMGRQLDPNNPLYSGSASNGGAPLEARPDLKPALAMGAAAVGVMAAESSAPQAPAADIAPDFDLGLAEEVAAVEEAGPVESQPEPDEHVMEFELDLDQPAPAAQVEEPVAEPMYEASAAEELGEDDELSLDLDTIIPQAVEKQLLREQEEATAAALSPVEPDAEFELDLDAPVAVQPVQAPAAAEEELELDLDLGMGAPAAAQSEPAAPIASVEEEQPIALEVPQESPLDFNFDLDEEAAPITISAAPAPEGSELDLSGIDLNMDDAPSANQSAEAGTGDQWQEVSTKLDLAKAYVEMGDKEGAREILQEVMQEGDATQKSDAKTMLASL